MNIVYKKCGPRIDQFTELRPLNRYVLHTTTRFYDPIIIEEVYEGESTFFQEVIKTETKYHIQWKNIWGDIKSLLTLKFQYIPKIALSLAAFWFILQGKHQESFDLAFIGAITLDGTVTTFEYATSSASITVASNSNRMMIASYATYQGGGPSAVSYNSVSLTKIVEKVGSFSEQASIWGLVAPSTGTNTFSVSSMGNWSCIGAYSLYDCDQNLPSTTNTAGGESSSASISLTTLADNSWVIASFEAEPTITMTTSGGTQDFNQQGASYQNGQGQHILKATAGSQTMSSSLSYGARWNVAALELKVVAAAAGQPTIKRIRTVPHLAGSGRVVGRFN